MANWCMTVIVMAGKETDVKKLQYDIERLVKIDRKGCAEPWSFENNSNWLGYVAVGLLGVSWNSIDCRGTILGMPYTVVDKDKEEWRIEMCWETAWSPCYELQERLAEKYGLKLYFCADESGCCIHETNDINRRFFKDCYVWDDGAEPVGYATFDELAADFIGLYGGEVRDQDHLEERIANELENGEDHSIIKYVLVDNEGKPLE